MIDRGLPEPRLGTQVRLPPRRDQRDQADAQERGEELGP
jgi:hypothetical protein